MSRRNRSAEEQVHRHISIITVSKGTPLSLGADSFTLPE